MKKTVKVKTLVIALASAGLASIPGYSLANPTGGQVVAGNATIRQENATKVGITQTTDKAIIDWQKFSIGANEHVQYYQPSAASVTLNRVVGQDPSQILGRLSANGQVFLVNPNGIYFGKNAQIDVAGLVASTHNIRNEDFMAGKYLFNIPGKPGASVINEGQIRIADTGIAAFVAPSVANRGVIAAKLGKVALASANGFTLDFHGDELLTFMVGDEVAKTAFDLEGNQLTSFVENSGKIQASGGYVLLTAKAAENAIHNVINQSGLIEATSVGQQNGEIILSGGQHGVVSNTGTLDASGTAAGQTGGKVQITGEKIGLFAGTLIDVSGDQGGGKAIVGGDYLGGQASDALMAELGIQRESKPVQTATFTNMAKEAVINADALTAGKGGKVVLWSDNTTRAFGTVTSRGYGNGLGGFIEVSGKNALDIFGLELSAGSENAKGGTILFDPVSVNIVDHNQAQTGINVSNFSASNSTDISSQAIQDILNTGSNVTIRTNNTGGQGDIHVKSNILKTAGGDATLSLLANSGIYVNYGKTIQSLKGKLNVIMNSDTDDISGGFILIRKQSGSDDYAIATNGGNVILRAWDTILDGRAIQTLGGDVTIRRINNSASWVTIGPSASNYYTLDAFTGKLTIDLKYNNSASNDGDFIEFHNHAARAMSMDINSSSVRNHSSGYSYGNSHYSYTLPAYDARDHEAEIAYQAGKVTMRGGATLSVLDGKVHDETFFRNELKEKYQDVAKRYEDYLAILILGKSGAIPDSAEKTKIEIIGKKNPNNNYLSDQVSKWNKSIFESDREFIGNMREIDIFNALPGDGGTDKLLNIETNAVLVKDETGKYIAKTGDVDVVSTKLKTTYAVGGPWKLSNVDKVLDQIIRDRATFPGYANIQVIDLRDQSITPELLDKLNQFTVQLREKGVSVISIKNQGDLDGFSKMNKAIADAGKTIPTFIAEIRNNASKKLNTPPTSAFLSESKASKYLKKAPGAIGAFAAVLGTAVYVKELHDNIGELAEKFPTLKLSITPSEIISATISDSLGVIKTAIEPGEPLRETDSASKTIDWFKSMEDWEKNLSKNEAMTLKELITTPRNKEQFQLSEFGGLVQYLQIKKEAISLQHGIAYADATYGWLDKVETKITATGVFLKISN